MKLYGLLVVQNEADIIEDLLEFLGNLGIYEAIFLFDLGSTDDTFARAQKFNDILYKPQVLQEPYTEKLRYDLLAQYHSLYQEGDWLSIVDADEFYVDNPLDFIRFAESEGTTCIRTYQIEFMFTDIDLANLENEDASLPIYERRKHYLIDWSEPRFYKFLDQNRVFSPSKPSSRRLLNRHYPNRTPAQISERIKTRLENRKKTRGIRGRQDWLQIFSPDWKDYIVPHQIVHEYTGGEYVFGLPEGIRWSGYFTKDPSCGIVPQTANLLAKERTASIGVTGSNPLTSYGSSKGKITFEDRYAMVLLSEVRSDFSAHHWKAALGGFLILIRYKIRMFLKSLSAKFRLRTFEIKNVAWNAMTSLERMMRLKSVGILTADPNPVEVSDVSGAGVTTLKWKSIFTEKIELRIDSPEGDIIHSATTSGSITTGNWISDDMVFYLQDVSRGLSSTASNTLSRVTVKITRGEKITI